jgi:hypothetical protein
MRVCSSWRPLDRRAAARVTTNLRAERAEGRVAAAPRPRRWLASLVGLALVGLMVLGVGAHQLGDTSHPGGEQPTPLAAVSLRSAARQRPAAARPSRSHVWSAYGYAIQAPQPLWPALEFIRARGGFDWVLDVLDAGQTQVRFGSLPPRTLGVYNAQQNEVVLADALQIANVEVVAATLVHEATHLSDAQHGRWQNSTSACLTFERQAFSNEAAFWRAAFGPEGKFAPGDAWESALNNLLVSGTSENLVEAYADECGSLAQ